MAAEGDAHGRGDRAGRPGTGREAGGHGSGHGAAGKVVWLHYYEGYQTDEIAEMLERPPSTVRNQLRDARARLKITLGGEGA